MPKPSAIHLEKPRWTMEQCRAYLEQRFATVLCHPSDAHEIPDEHFANQLRDHGNRYKQWHIDAFDRVYDRVDDGMSVSAACRAVQDEMRSEIDEIDPGSFRSMFYRFRRVDEVRIRRILIVGAMMHHTMHPGVAQCVRLSRRIDPSAVLDPH